MRQFFFFGGERGTLKYIALPTVRKKHCWHLAVPLWCFSHWQNNKSIWRKGLVAHSLRGVMATGTRCCRCLYPGSRYPECCAQPVSLFLQYWDGWYSLYTHSPIQKLQDTPKSWSPRWFQMLSSLQHWSSQPSQTCPVHSLPGPCR